MALSDYEKKILAEMEQHLRQQDPDLADAMSKAAPPAPSAAPSESNLSPRRIALGSILAAAGLAIVLVGVTIGFSVLTIVLGALGFLMMVAGVLYALSSDRPKGQVRERPRTPAGKQPSNSTGSTKATRDQRRRDRWENRG